MISRLSPLSSVPLTRASVEKGVKLAGEAPVLPQDQLQLSGSPAGGKVDMTPGSKVLLGSLMAVSGLGGLTGAASALIQMATKEPAQIQAATVSAMLARDTKLTAPSPEKVHTLQKSLAPVDLSLLQLAQREGIVFQVVHPGDNLLEAKVIRAKPDTYVREQMPQLRSFSDRLGAQVESKFTRPLAELAKKIKPNQGLSFQQDPDQMAYNQMLKEQGTFLADQVSASGLPLKFFSVPIPDGVVMDSNMVSMLNMQSQMPTSLEQMARVHGATTPAQVAEFVGMVRDINGPRLTNELERIADTTVQMRSLALSSEGKTLSAADETALRANLASQATTVPVDHYSLQLLVPDLFYKSIQGQTVKVDGHDRGTLENWTGSLDPSGEQKVTGKVNDDTQGVLGQFFYLDDVNRILLRDTQVGGRPPVHELGHALEHLLQKKDPKFYAGWKKDAQAAYDAMMKNTFSSDGNGKSHPVTAYSETNLGEYVAEGFAHHYLNPKEFASQDPDFARCMERFVERLQQLSSHQPSGLQTLGDYLRSRTP